MTEMKVQHRGRALLLTYMGCFADVSVRQALLGAVDEAWCFVALAVHVVHLQQVSSHVVLRS